MGSLKVKDRVPIANRGQQRNGRAKAGLKTVRDSSAIKDTCAHRVSDADKGNTSAYSGAPMEGANHRRGHREAGLQEGANLLTS